jgi:hypothetical protein
MEHPISTWLLIGPASIGGVRAITAIGPAVHRLAAGPKSLPRRYAAKCRDRHVESALSDLGRQTGGIAHPDKAR